MRPMKLDEIRTKRKAERMAQLKELKEELKKLNEEPSLPGAKVTDGGAPNKLSEREKLGLLLTEVAKLPMAALRESNKYKTFIPLDLRRRNSQEDPCFPAASSPGVIMFPAFSDDEEEKEA